MNPVDHGCQCAVIRKTLTGYEIELLRPFAVQKLIRRISDLPVEQQWAKAVAEAAEYEPQEIEWKGWLYVDVMLRQYLAAGGELP